MDRRCIRGAVIGVLHEDKKFITPFGIKKLVHPLPVIDNTLFRIALITITPLAPAVSLAITRLH